MSDDNNIKNRWSLQLRLQNNVDDNENNYVDTIVMDSITIRVITTIITNNIYQKNITHDHTICTIH